MARRRATGMHPWRTTIRSRSTPCSERSATRSTGGTCRGATARRGSRVRTGRAARRGAWASTIALDYPLGDRTRTTRRIGTPPTSRPPATTRRSDYAAHAPDADDARRRARPGWRLRRCCSSGSSPASAGGWFLFSGRDDASSARGDSRGSPTIPTARRRPATDHLHATHRQRQRLTGGCRPGPRVDRRCRATAGGTRAGRYPARRPLRLRRRDRRREPRATAAAPARAAAAPRRDRRRAAVSSSARVRPAPASRSAGGAGASRRPRVTDLAYGRHTVRVSRSGYVDRAAPRDAVGAPPGADRRCHAASATRPAPRPRPPRAAREQERFVGTLVVESRPAGAKVFLDGRASGSRR